MGKNMQESGTPGLDSTMEHDFTRLVLHTNQVRVCGGVYLR